MATLFCFLRKSHTVLHSLCTYAFSYNAYIHYHRNIDCNEVIFFSLLLTLTTHQLFFTVVIVAQLLNHASLFVTLWTAACQASLSIISSQSLPKLMSIESVMPSNHLILCHPLVLHTQSFPVSESFPMSQLFASGGQSVGASASTSVLPMNTQDWSPIGCTGWSPCSPRDSQESSPTPQFKSINSSLLYIKKKDNFKEGHGEQSSQRIFIYKPHILPYAYFIWGL